MFTRLARNVNAKIQPMPLRWSAGHSQLLGGGRSENLKGFTAGLWHRRQAHAASPRIESLALSVWLTGTRTRLTSPGSSRNRKLTHQAKGAVLVFCAV